MALKTGLTWTLLLAALVTASQLRRLSQTGGTRFNATTGFHPVRVVGENTKQLGSGPFLGNGTRNGWADQTSIVIWTRTTREPEMRADGRPFIKIDNQRARQL
ncbi:MAG: hypothetical protein VXZ53_18515, partial [Planctomycetota bacterium]|nr:hypothetical protein [Planctomycetota bacterium]